MTDPQRTPPQPGEELVLLIVAWGVDDLPEVEYSEDEEDQEEDDARP